MLLACVFLLIYIDQTQCILDAEINTEHQNCSFIFSNGYYEEFAENLSLFKDCTMQFKNPHLVVKLTNYFLPAFPNRSFSNVGYLKSFKLEIADGSKVQLLSPLLPEYFVFEDMEFSDGVIDISDSGSLTGWKWEALSNIKYEAIRSFEFNVVRSKLIYLRSSFQKIANGRLTVIRILKCHLRWLGKGAFASFSRLKNLELRNNFIEQIERYHLPTEASNLYSLDLGNNRLTHFSPDLFNGLQLQSILLDGNNIKLLDMKIMLEADSLPLIHGVIWFCSCNQSLRLPETFDEEECNLNENTLKIKIFKEKHCESQQM